MEIRSRSLFVPCIQLVRSLFSLSLRPPQKRKNQIAGVTEQHVTQKRILTKIAENEKSDDVVLIVLLLFIFCHCR